MLLTSHSIGSSKSSESLAPTLSALLQLLPSQLSPAPDICMNSFTAALWSVKGGSSSLMNELQNKEECSRVCYTTDHGKLEPPRYRRPSSIQICRSSWEHEIHRGRKQSGVLGTGREGGESYSVVGADFRLTRSRVL